MSVVWHLIQITSAGCGPTRARAPHRGFYRESFELPMGLPLLDAAPEGLGFPIRRPFSAAAEARNCDALDFFGIFDRNRNIMRPRAFFRRALESNALCGSTLGPLKGLTPVLPWRESIRQVL